MAFCYEVGGKFKDLLDDPKYIALGTRTKCGCGRELPPRIDIHRP